MRCSICELRCDILPGKSGKCGMYINNWSEIMGKFPNFYSFFMPILSEQIPMLHFYPNSRFLAVSTTGCNFSCRGCISRLFTQGDIASKLLQKANPEEVVRMAKKEECIGIVFCINEPTVSWPTFLELAKKAKDSGLLVGMSTNLYQTVNALEEVIPYLDFVNAGVKGFSDSVYQGLCGVPSAEPVFRNLKLLYEHNIHIEVSIPYIRGMEKEIIDVAKFLSSLSRDIPLQITKFMPPKFEKETPLIQPSFEEAERLCEGVRRYLNYVYLFNSPGTKWLDTYIEGKPVIRRAFYGPMAAKVTEYDEEKSKKVVKGCFGNGFKGKSLPWNGYKVTGVFESIVSIFRKYEMSEENAVIGTILAYRNGLFELLHRALNECKSPYDFLEFMEELERVAGENLETKEIRKSLSDIEKKRKRIKIKRKVYIALGHPLHARRKGSFQNKFVEFIRGISVNELIPKGDKVGENVTPDEINSMSPDIIFIEPYFSWSVEDFKRECTRLGIKVKGKIYRIPDGYRDLANWFEFLLYLATKTYPEVYK